LPAPTLVAVTFISVPSIWRKQHSVAYGGTQLPLAEAGGKRYCLRKYSCLYKDLAAAQINFVAFAERWGANSAALMVKKSKVHSWENFEHELDSKYWQAYNVFWLTIWRLCVKRSYNINDKIWSNSIVTDIGARCKECFKDLLSPVTLTPSKLETQFWGEKIYVLESCAGRVNSRGLRVPAFAERVREPALLCVRVRSGCGLNLLRVRGGRG